MSSKIKLGIIGTGGIVRTAHMPAIRQLAEIKLTAICDVDKQKADRLAREWGVEGGYSDYKDLVKSRNVDAVIVATPTACHKNHTIAAAKEGKHVLCEKPLATSLKDAREMIEVCKHNKVKLQVGLNFRFFNQVRIAKELVDLEVIGKIKAYESIYRISGDEDEADTDFRDDLKRSGGGCLMDAAVHQADMARFLVAEISQICAEVKHSVGGFAAALDDNSLILCDFANGAIGCISTDRFSPMMCKVALYGTEGTILVSMDTFFQSAPLAIYTKKATSEIPDIALKYFYPILYNEEPSRRWISIVPPKDDSYLGQLKAFCRSISEDIEPPVTGQDGVKSLEVILAAYKSAKERKWIELPMRGEEITHT